ncbi:unnamed protein product [Arctogadus glacialis]
MGDRAIFITAGSQPFGIMYKRGPGASGLSSAAAAPGDSDVRGDGTRGLCWSPTEPLRRGPDEESQAL